MSTSMIFLNSACNRLR